MTKLIVFDLETSEKYAVGQILNMAAVTVDENFNIIDTFYRDVKISKNQLPSPEALLVNRVDPLLQQQIATVDEKTAIKEFYAYVENHAMSDKVIIGGQNICKFDINFLRTNALRCGIEPYWYNVQYADLMFLSRRLVLTNEDFRILMTDHIADKIHINLQWVTDRLNLSNIPQTHNSLDDVMMTIDVYKHYKEKYNLNVFNFDAYEPRTKNIKIGDVYEVGVMRMNKAYKKLYAFLWEDKRGAFWVNITNYKDTETAKNLVWYNKNSSDMVLGNKITDSETIEKVNEIFKLQFYKDVMLGKKVYQDTFDLDPELNIKSIDLDMIRAGIDFMNTGASILFESYQWQDQQQPSYCNMMEIVNRHDMLYANNDEYFKKYVKYRYGGKMKINRPFTPSYSKPGTPTKIESEFHESLDERLSKLENLLQTRTDPDDQNILNNLKTFILSSEAYNIFIGEDHAASV